MAVQILEEKTAVIRPSANRVSVVLTSIWLAFWVPAGSIAFFVRGKATDAPARLFLASWVLLWAFFTWTTLRAVLWQLTGSEALRVVGKELRIETRFFFVSRVRTIPLHSIQDMNVHIERTSSKGRTFTRRFVVLHGAYGTLKLRSALEPGEGQRVVDFLRAAVK